MSVSLLLILVTVAVSVSGFSNRGLMSRLIFNPYVIRSRGEWYRFLSSGFIHADWIHLVINMFVLYSFGPVVERYYSYAFEGQGTYYFMLLYLGGMVTAILPTYRKYADRPSYNALGASGAVSSIVFAFILFNPLEKLCLYGVLCLPGIFFGAGYLFYCYYMDKRGGDRINHDAHLWGALFGWVFTALLKPALIVAFFQQLIYFRNVI
jgi:membrane associated rhomboid family serine protease